MAAAGNERIYFEKNKIPAADLEYGDFREGREDGQPVQPRRFFLLS